MRVTEFERYLLGNHIRQILGRVNHFQTNSKMEKWFDVLEKELKFFSSIDGCLKWYNTFKPHRGSRPKDSHQGVLREDSAAGRPVVPFIP